jgi:methyltransferase
MKARRRLPAWYLGLAVTSGALRLIELGRSSRNERRLGAAGQPAAGHFPIVVALHVALHIVPLVEVFVFRRRPRLPWLWAGVLVSATALRWWSIGSLGAAWNARGAVPDQLPVVTTGPYRFIRHPNYVAVTADFLALPLAGGAWISALGLTALDLLLLAERVREEERRLLALPAYREAFGRRKRFIPGVW